MFETMTEIAVKIVPENGNSGVNDTVVTARRLVDLEQVKARSRMLAYDRVAAKVGKTGEWLRKFIRSGGDIKRSVADRLDALLLKTLEADVAKLTSELEVAQKSRVHPARTHVREIETHLSEAKRLMKEAGE